MEKVKLTPEQANAIKKWINKEQLIIAKASGLLEHSIDESIAELTMEQLVKALYIGYEVEPEFKVGDWVFIDYGEAGTEIGFIKGWINEPHSFYIDKCHFGANVNEARHATPEEIAEEKERRWWRRHGRKVWELRKGDILINNGNDVSYQIVGVHKNGDIAFEHDTDYRDKSIIRNNYKVACFAEQRLDWEGE